MSRWTISSSAIDGHPGRPSRLQHVALVHHRAFGEPGHLAVLGERDAEVERVLERPAHQQRILHAVAVVGEEVHAGGGELGERRELLAVAADRDRSRREHVAQPGELALAADEVDHARPQSWVGSVLGIATIAVKPPSAAARLPGLDRLGLLLARLAEVGVEVDEARG